MTLVNWSRFPLVAGDEYARRWLQFTANIGRAANTVDAYGRAVEDHLRFCRLTGAQPVTLRADVVAAWIADMDQRPLPSRTGDENEEVEFGLSNATIQQRVVAVRSFYDYLVEDGLRDRNPVRRGQSGRRSQRPRQGMVRRVVKAPWIPNEEAWSRVLTATMRESLRNRLMVALAYDGALRREELVSLDVDDLEPAWSLVHLRAETTKAKRAREVSFGAATGQLLVAYLRQRRQAFGRIGGALLRSESRRNRGAPLGPSSWSKAVTRLGARAEVPQLAPHTFRHLRLTDLARAEWTLEQIAQYAGHRDVSTTMLYIHLSGRELAAKLRKATASVQARREALLAALVEV
jgi:site-specific recombinase XerD